MSISSKLFQRPSTATESQTPNDVARMLQRRDLILKPAHDIRRIAMGAGAHVVRVLPPVVGSRFESWMVPFETYKLGNQPEVVMPSSVVAGSGDDVIQSFRKFIYTNHREIAYTKADRENPKHNKLVLNTSKKGVSWIIHTTPDILSPKPDIPVFLLVGSNSDGQYGGQPGFLHKIVQLTEELDADPSSATHRHKLYGNISDPEIGRNIIIRVEGEKKGKKYSISAGRSPSLLDTYLMPIVTDHPEFETILVPLEDTLHIPDEAELTNLLKNYVRSLGHLAALDEFFGRAEPTAVQTREVAARAQTPVAPLAPETTGRTVTAIEAEDEIPGLEEKPVAPKADAPKAAPKVEGPAPAAPAPVVAVATEAAPAPTATVNATLEAPEIYAGFRADMRLLKAHLTITRAAQKAAQEVPKPDEPTNDAWFRVLKNFSKIEKVGGKDWDTVQALVDIDQM